MEFCLDIDYLFGAILMIERALVEVEFYVTEIDLTDYGTEATLLGRALLVSI